jgi:hypothetical protein
VCSGLRPTPVTADEQREESPSTKAIAEPVTPAPKPIPKPRPMTRGGSEIVTYDQPALPRQRALAAALENKRSDLWDPCVRELVQTRREEIRDELGDMLAQAMTTCSRETRSVSFEPPRSGRAYATGSHIGIAGVLTPTTTDVVLRVVVRGPRPQRLTILAGGTRWTSSELEVTHDAIWQRELAAIPYTKSLARVVRRMIDTDGAILRFESDAGIDDVVVTEELATDLRAMLDVVDDL